MRECHSGSEKKLIVHSARRGWNRVKVPHHLGELLGARSFAMESTGLNHFGIMRRVRDRAICPGSARRLPDEVAPDPSGRMPSMAMSAISTSLRAQAFCASASVVAYVRDIGSQCTSKSLKKASLSSTMKEVSDCCEGLFRISL